MYMYYYVVIIGYYTAMVCQEPVIIGQYGPAAYHSRVVTFLLHIFGGFQNLLNNKNTLKLKRKIINTFR